MNIVIMSGRLTRDSQLTLVGANDTPKLSFALAVERSYQKDKENKVVDFVDMEVWGARAKSLAPYLVKGKAVLIEGELNVYKYTNDKGENRVRTTINVDKLEFIGGKPVVNNEDGFDNNKPVVKEDNVNNPTFETLDDEDIPF